MKVEWNMKETELEKVLFKVRILLTLLDKYNKIHLFQIYILEEEQRGKVKSEWTGKGQIHREWQMGRKSETSSVAENKQCGAHRPKKLSLVVFLNLWKEDGEMEAGMQMSRHQYLQKHGKGGMVGKRKKLYCDAEPTKPSSYFTRRSGARRTLLSYPKLEQGSQVFTTSVNHLLDVGMSDRTHESEQGSFLQLTPSPKRSEGTGSMQKLNDQISHLISPSFSLPNVWPFTYLWLSFLCL